MPIDIQVVQFLLFELVGTILSGLVGVQAILCLFWILFLFHCHQVAVLSFS